MEKYGQKMHWVKISKKNIENFGAMELAKFGGPQKSRFWQLKFFNPLACGAISIIFVIFVKDLPF